MPSPEKNAPFKTISITPRKRAAPGIDLSVPPPKMMLLGITPQVTHVSLIDFATNDLASVPPHKGHCVSESSPTLPTTPVTKMSQHILLEGFPLIMDKIEPPRTPLSAEVDMIFDMFDGVFAVHFSPTFLIIRCRSLPPKPWPISIGGMPIWLTDSETDMPYPQGKAGCSSPVLDDLRLSRVSSPAGETFELIAKYFADEHKIALLEIMWDGPRLFIRIPDTIQISSLPVRIGNLAAVYSDKSVIPQHHEAARRLVSPTATVRDDTSYSPHLRPGIMLSCGSALGGAELFTSSGVIVKDKQGDTWLTVASHGFPRGSSTVYHPNPNHPPIGTIEKRFPGTDISLAKLHTGFSYAAHTFVTDLQPATEITALGVPAELGIKLGDVLRMENAFTGYCEGVFIGNVWQAIPADEVTDRVPWVIFNNFYLGNGLEEPVDGCCGCPVLTDAGVLVGLFRFLTNYGVAYCVSAEVLIAMGMTLSSITL